MAGFTVKLRCAWETLLNEQGDVFGDDGSSVHDLPDIIIYFLVDAKAKRFSHGCSFYIFLQGNCTRHLRCTFSNHLCQQRC